MTIQVPLSRGLFATIDAADTALVAQFRWYARPKDAKSLGFYAFAKPTQKITIYMHRLLLAAPAGMQVDHVDGDGLNNRRSNLRLATQQLNNVNREYTSASGFRGVYRNKNRWRAMIDVRKRHINLGNYVDPADAARAYYAAARKYFGEFARLNFPEAA
jgi:hypothetical protein